jgi:hypothetical protein
VMLMMVVLCLGAERPQRKHCDEKRSHAALPM